MKSQQAPMQVLVAGLRFGHNHPVWPWKRSCVINWTRRWKSAFESSCAKRIRITRMPWMTNVVCVWMYTWWLCSVIWNHTLRSPIPARPDTPGAIAAQTRDEAFDTSNSIFSVHVSCAFWACCGECTCICCVLVVIVFGYCLTRPFLNRKRSEGPKTNGMLTNFWNHNRDENRNLNDFCALSFILSFSNIHYFCRSGTKWNLSLQNGIMFLNGSQWDYCVLSPNTFST